MQSHALYKSYREGLLLRMAQEGHRCGVRCEGAGPGPTLSRRMALGNVPISLGPTELLYKRGKPPRRTVLRIIRDGESKLLAISEEHKKTWFSSQSGAAEPLRSTVHRALASPHSGREATPALIQNSVVG